MDTSLITGEFVYATRNTWKYCLCDFLIVCTLFALYGTLHAHGCPWYVMALMVPGQVLAGREYLTWWPETVPEEFQQWEG